MMPATVAALAAGHRVSRAVLAEFAFRSSTQRFWDGLRWLTAGGQQWLGAGQLISIDGLEHAAGMGASAATFRLSGVDATLLAIAADSRSEVAGRRCAVYWQFLDESTGTALDDPIALWVGTMDVMTFAAGVDAQSITLTAETRFSRRVRAPWGMLTDADQQARYPGDRGLEFMPTLISKTVDWLRA